MATASFKMDGARLSVELQCQPARDGSYDLRLWHSDLNKVLREWPGNFRNTDDDRYDLPGLAGANDGRSVQALVVVAIPEGISPSTLSLIVRQGEVELAREERVAPPGAVDQMLQLWIDLVGEV